MSAARIPLAAALAALLPLLPACDDETPGVQLRPVAVTGRAVVAGGKPLQGVVVTLGNRHTTVTGEDGLRATRIAELALNGGGLY